MKVISVDNVNEALLAGIALMKKEGEAVESRGGATVEVPCPVSTVYNRPWERVLISKERDANPFFHLMESMWILAGRKDVKFLSEFNKRISEYSDNGIVFNAPYGHRLIRGVGKFYKNQLQIIIDMLIKDPMTRQAVCQIWDCNDIDKSTKDKACNMSIVFRKRNSKLDMIVYNRSNDIIWGAYGANVVQFSMIHEYVSAKTGIEMGRYTQVSNSFHAYTTGPGGDVWNRVKDVNIKNPYHGGQFARTIRMKSHDMSNFDWDLKQLFGIYDVYGYDIEAYDRLDFTWQSEYFNALVYPVFKTYNRYKEKGIDSGMNMSRKILGCDWRLACQQWLEIRLENKSR